MNNTIKLTKRFNFEAAHALYGYDGQCKNVHGHSYRLYVTIIGSPITDSKNVKFGMVMDFTDLKNIVNEVIVIPIDHSTILNINSPHKELADIMVESGHKVHKVNYQPTCEMMIIDFAKRISSKLPSNIILSNLKLQETDSSFAEWGLKDQN
jgi:6-pyruvoyltetrahydropterin/6-carboxytetrahydropterin synthase